MASKSNSVVIGRGQYQGTTVTRSEYGRARNAAVVGVLGGYVAGSVIGGVALASAPAVIGVGVAIGAPVYGALKLSGVLANRSLGKSLNAAARPAAQSKGKGKGGGNPNAKPPQLSKAQRQRIARNRMRDNRGRFN